MVGPVGREQVVVCLKVVVAALVCAITSPVHRFIMAVAVVGRVTIVLAAQQELVARVVVVLVVKTLQANQELLPQAVAVAVPAITVVVGQAVRVWSS